MTKIKQKTTRAMPRDRSLESWYQKKLCTLVKQMGEDTQKAVLGVWKKYGSEIAQDSADEIPDSAVVVSSLRKKWKNRFDNMSEDVSEEFTRRADKGTTGHLKNLLKEVGFSVEFTSNECVEKILEDKARENAKLITKLQADHFEQIEEITKQGIKKGRDLAYIRDELRERLGMDERRAILIARDQTNKITGALSRQRTLDAGIRKAVWQHIGGKKMNRSSHEAMDGKEFDLDEKEGGLWDPAVGRDIFPGELVNCNCKYRIVVPDLGQEGGVPLKDSMDGGIIATNAPKTKAAKKLQKKREAVRAGVEKLLHGDESEVIIENLRDDLGAYGGTNNVTLIKGNKKEGLEHIIANGREHYLGGILDAVIEGKIDTDYKPRGEQKVRLNHGNYQAVLVLEDKTWALTGWDVRTNPKDEKARYKWKQEQKKPAKDEKCEWHTAHNLRKQGIFHSASLGAFTSLSLTSDEKGKVSTRHLPTQTMPTSSRHCLGADASVRDMVRIWKKKVK